jgi:hypothetical protein
MNTEPPKRSVEAINMFMHACFGTTVEGTEVLKSGLICAQELQTYAVANSAEVDTALEKLAAALGPVPRASAILALIASLGAIAQEITPYSGDTEATPKAVGIAISRLLFGMLDMEVTEDELEAHSDAGV